MRNISFITFFLLVFTNVNAQEDLKAYFKSSIDTIISGSEMEVMRSFEVIVPKQPKYNDARVEVYVENNPMSPNRVLIFLQEDNILQVDSERDVTKTFNIKFSRNSKDDRLIIIKLKAFDKNNVQLKIENPLSSYSLYIKPLQKEISEEEKYGYQLWFHTGTNFDLLDGIKAKDLYFKGSYLLNIRKNSNETSSWLHSSFGRNRYFSVMDSVNDISFQHPLLNPARSDSVRVVNGYYNTVIQTTTENIFASVDYLYNIKNLSNKNSRLFISAGIYWGLQEIKHSYRNTFTLTDTVFLPISNLPDRFTSPAKEMRIRLVNKNIGIGFLHILSTPKLDVKTKFTSGINFLTFPRRIVKSGLSTEQYFEQEKNIYFMFSTEATVLNPGVSIGFETLVRENNFPLYNIFLTKILTLEKLAGLFSPIPSLGSN